jgi:hypothetical protein
VRKLLLNLALGEPLSLVEVLHYLENPKKLDPLLVSSLDPCVHYLISGCLFHAIMVELFGVIFFAIYEVSNKGRKYG